MDYIETFNQMFAYLGDEESLEATTDIVPVTEDVQILCNSVRQIETFVRDSNWDGLREYFTTQFGEDATPLIKICNLLEANTHSEEDKHECLETCEEICGDIWEFWYRHNNNYGEEEA